MVFGEADPPSAEWKEVERIFPWLAVAVRRRLNALPTARGFAAWILDLR